MTVTSNRMRALIEILYVYILFHTFFIILLFSMKNDLRLRFPK